MNGDDIVATVTICRQKGILLELKKRFIIYDAKRDSLKFVATNGNSAEYKIVQLHYRKVKVPSIKDTNKVPSLMLTIELNKKDPENGTDIQIKLMFEGEHTLKVDYLVNKINERLEANEAVMKGKTKTDIKRMPGSQEELSRYDPYARRSLIDRTRFCDKDTTSRLAEIVMDPKTSDFPMSRLVAQSDQIDTGPSLKRPATSAIERPASRKESRDYLQAKVQKQAPRPQTAAAFHSGPSASSRAEQKPVLSEPRPPSMFPTLRPLRDQPTDSPARRRLFTPSPSMSPIVDEPPVPDPVRAPTPPPPPARRPFQNRKLTNTGNSCFLNSTMQALAACFPVVTRCNTLLRKYMNKGNKMFGDQSPNRELKISVLVRFMQIVKTLGARENDTVYVIPTEAPPFPRETDEKILRKTRETFGELNNFFNNTEQQDAHEYLILLLGTIDDVMQALAVASGLDLSGNPIDYGVSEYCLNPAGVFQMKVEICYICQNCLNEERKTELRSDISLEIREGASVQELLSSFGKWSAVEKKCECGHNAASTSERIVQFPLCLIINLRRYERENCKVGYKKNNCIVDSSHELDTSVLSVFRIPEYPELEKTVVLPKEPEKLLGGANDSSNSSDDVIIDRVAPTVYTFKPLRDQDQVDAMLKHIGVHLNSRQLSLQMAKLAEAPVVKMNKKDEPENSITIKGDGNCFYRAVSWYLTGKENHHSELRKAAAKFIKDHPQIITKYTDNYNLLLHNVSNDGEWAEQSVIIAIATLFNVEIFTYLKHGWERYLPRQDESFKPIFPLCKGAIYLNNKCEHYEPVINMGKKMERQMRNRKRAAEDGDDEDDDNEKDLALFNREDKKREAREDSRQSTRTSLGRSCKQSGSTSFSSKKADYSLVSVVCHQGESPAKGHYVAYTKDYYSDEWMYCSDDVVRLVPRDTVDSEMSSSGYVLFYNKI